MNKDVHFVLKLQAKLRPPAPAVVLSEDAQVAAPETYDPATLLLKIQHFNPWGCLPGATLPPPTPLTLPSPPPAGSSNSLHALYNAVEEAASALPAPPLTFILEHHFKLTVDENVVRSMAMSRASIELPIEVATPPPPPAPPPPKSAKKGEAPPPPPPPAPSASFSGVLHLDCSGLLVGDTSCSRAWPHQKMGPAPGTLHEILDVVSLSLTALDIPPPPEPDPTVVAAAPASGKGGKPKPGSAAKGKEVKETAPEPDLSNLKGDPTPILTKDLAAKLNPIVILPRRAKRLPDAPATIQLLATKCSPTSLKINWPPTTSFLSGESREQSAANATAWKEADDDGDRDEGDAAPAVSGSKVHVRDVEFGSPEVYLAADYSLEGLIRACKEEPLMVTVHDRTAIPDPPEFPLPQVQGSESVMDHKVKDDGFVCGVAKMPLHDLLKGRTQVKFRVPLLPYSTIRGAASLDWTTRPGNYCQAGSEVKVLVRLAVPLTQTLGYQPQERVFSRAVFVMDYRDSGLFHAIEDMVRKHNAWRLGFAVLDPPSASSPLKQSDGQSTNARPMSKSSTRGGGILAPFEEEDMLMPSFSGALDEALGIYEDNDGVADDKAFGGSNPLVERGNSYSHGSSSVAGLRLPSIFLRPQVNSFTAAGFTHEKLRQRSAHRHSPHSPHTSPSATSTNVNVSQLNPQFLSHGGASLGTATGQPGVVLPEPEGGINISRNPTFGGAGGGDTRKMARFRSLKGLAQVQSFRSRPSESHAQSAAVSSEHPGNRATVSTAAPGGSAASSPKRRKGEEDDEDEDDGSLASEEEVSAPEQKMRVALSYLDKVLIDSKLVQTLSTTKLTPEQSSDPSLDIVTGFHLVDGKERIIVLEGTETPSAAHEADASTSHGQGAMTSIRAIMEWALSEPKPMAADDEDPQDPHFKPWRKREAVHNSKVRHPCRAWGELGVDLYIIKLRASLVRLLSEADSYSAGKVRVECIQGLRKLGELRSVQWARQADELSMFPSTHMIRLVDKKFGGELVKADILGVEVDEYDSDEVDGGTIALGGVVADRGDSMSEMHGAGSQVRSKIRSGAGKSAARTRRTMKSKKAARKRPKPLPIDCTNEAYLLMKEEARAHRLAINWLEVNVDSLGPMAEALADVRDQWAEWNPQREAAKRLEEDVRAGRLTLEDTIVARDEYFKALEASSAERCAGTGLVDPSLAASLGRHPHEKPFLWPSPKSPGTYTVPNPLPPSSLFITEPWVEGEGQPSVSLNPNSQRGGFERGLPIFSTVVKNASGLFETNPEFLKTVHSGGVGREKEEEAVRRAEKEEWEKRVVVEDKVLRVTLPRGPDRPAQVDKFKSILHGQPKKKSIKDTHVPPPPFSIFKASEQHNKQRTVEAAKDRSKFDPTLSVGESDFDRYKVVLPPKSFVARQAKPNSDDL